MVAGRDRVFGKENDVQRNGLLITTLAMLCTASGAWADCSACTANVRNDGWCDKCKVGYYDGVKLAFRPAYDVLQPIAADTLAAKCEGCKKAAASNGACDTCRIRFIDKQGYKSWVAVHFAGADRFDSEKSKCDECKRSKAAYRSCRACGANVIGNRKFKDAKTFEAALPARMALQSASATKCEGCAVAVLTNGKCAKCKLEYQNGQPAAEGADKTRKPGDRSDE
ncbi:MAG: hypothetical protein AB7Q17_02015 [Phycisphaerae bacterium]